MGREMENYHVTEFSLYQVICESCPNSTAQFTSPEEAAGAAGELGFTAMHTIEDGTLNFCKVCAAAQADI